MSFELPTNKHTYAIILLIVNIGLVGPLLVCKKGTLDENGEQKNVDKEFILYFIVSNENVAWYIKRNAKQFAGSSYEFGNVYIPDYLPIFGKGYMGD